MFQKTGVLVSLALASIVSTNLAYGGGLRLRQELSETVKFDRPVVFVDLENRLKLRGRMVKYLAQELAQMPDWEGLETTELQSLAQGLIVWDRSAHPRLIVSKTGVAQLSYQGTQEFGEGWELKLGDFWQASRDDLEQLNSGLQAAFAALGEGEKRAERQQAVRLALGYLDRLNQLNPLVGERSKQSQLPQKKTLDFLKFPVDEPADSAARLEQELQFSFDQTLAFVRWADLTGPALSTQAVDALSHADWLKRQLAFLADMTELNLIVQDHIAQQMVRDGAPEGLWNHHVDQVATGDVPVNGSDRPLSARTVNRVKQLAKDQKAAWTEWQSKRRRLAAYQRLASAQRPYLEQLDYLIAQTFEDPSPLRYQLLETAEGVFASLNIEGTVVGRQYVVDDRSNLSVTAARSLRISSGTKERVRLVVSSVRLTEQKSGDNFVHSFDRPPPSFEAVAYEELVGVRLPQLEKEVKSLQKKFTGQVNRWDHPLQIELAWVPGGCFEMGCTGEGCSHIAQPKHSVCVDSFLMSPFEVTQDLWTSVMGSNPSKFQLGGHYPVDSVSFEQTQVFLSKLETLGFRYRLPTEAEWEFACQAGKGKRFGTRFGWVNHNSANYEYTRDRDRWPQTAPVGQFAPNQLGLYDLSGNVAEWVADQFTLDSYAKSESHNPVNRKGAANILRGGSWFDGADRLSCMNRQVRVPSHSNYTAGLRLVRIP